MPEKLRGSFPAQEAGAEGVWIRVARTDGRVGRLYLRFVEQGEGEEARDPSVGLHVEVAVATHGFHPGAVSTAVGAFGGESIRLDMTPDVDLEAVVRALFSVQRADPRGRCVVWLGGTLDTSGSVVAAGAPQ